MAYEQTDGDIAIFAVKDKANEKGPDWTGRCLIDGVEKQISLWLKSDTMLAGKIQDKFKPDYKSVRDSVERTPEPKSTGTIPEDFEDSIPF